jgi:transposase
MSAPTDNLFQNLKAPLTRRQAAEIYAGGLEAVIFALMALSILALRAKPNAVPNAPPPETPSAMIPPYQKKTPRGRRKKPGAKPGHVGHARPLPKPTKVLEHPPLDNCPDCHGPLPAPGETTTRLIEDILAAQPEVTEHHVPRQWCTTCKKFVSPPVPDALPGATFGHRLVILSAWLHFALGLTLSPIVELLRYQLHFKLSAGGLVGAWHRYAAVFYPWYEQIGAEARASGVLHADETGWRVNGRTYWLWCFTTQWVTYYMIDRSRGSPALSKFFTSAFDGVLVTDFWAAYNAVVCAARQACLPHLFRELDKVDEKNGSADWRAFAKKLKRLLRDALRLRRRDDLTDAQFAARRTLIGGRLDDLLVDCCDSTDADVRRLHQRLCRYRLALLTFLDNPAVPSNNNHAEREIRPAVLMRKNSYCNRSLQGANTQAILMSIYRTLKRRGHNPLETMITAVRAYAATGQLPPLPPPTSNG